MPPRYLRSELCTGPLGAQAPNAAAHLMLLDLNAAPSRFVRAQGCSDLYADAPRCADVSGPSSEEGVFQPHRSRKGTPRPQPADRPRDVPHTPDTTRRRTPTTRHTHTENARTIRVYTSGRSSAAPESPRACAISMETVRSTGSALKPVFRTYAFFTTYCERRCAPVKPLKLKPVVKPDHLSPVHQLHMKINYRP